MLESKDENSLINLIEKCEKRNLKFTVFREPDLKNQITAIAVEPSIETQKIVSNLPLLFKNLN